MRAGEPWSVGRRDCAPSLQPHRPGDPERARDPPQVEEQACALGEELVVDLGVGGEDQREVGVLERLVEGEALQAVVAQRGDRWTLATQW